jgi:hypothetical protein
MSVQMLSLGVVFGMRHESGCSEGNVTCVQYLGDGAVQEQQDY